METGFAAYGFNYDNDYFMFVSGYPKCVYALVCSELFMFLVGNINYFNIAKNIVFGIEIEGEFPVRVYI